MIIPSRLLKDLFEQRNGTFAGVIGADIGGSMVVVSGGGCGGGTTIGSIGLPTDDADDDGGRLMN